MTTPFDIITTPIDPGLSVIEASAGTGKTYVISRLVPRLLLERTVSRLGEILLVTFTNDAARELSNRVRGVLEKLTGMPQPDEEKSDPAAHDLRQKFQQPDHRAVIARALLDIDQLGVSTIHSFCQRILQTEGTLCGLPVVPELIPDAEELIEEALYDLWKNQIAGDGLVSAIAAAQCWNPADDLAFVKQALGLDDLETDPPARPFEEVLQELKDASLKLTRPVLAELETFLQRVTAWTKSAPDEAGRREILDVLRAAKSAAHPGFFEAVQSLAEAEGWINGARKEGKPDKAKAATLPAVVFAKQICDHLQTVGWHWQLDCLAGIRKSVASALRKNRQITYDGLITTLRDALRSPKNGPLLAARLRGQFRVALIDESQDTDPRQFEIFRKVFGGPESRLVLIGDPKQAIYEFRGADVNTYLEAKTLAGGKIFSLSKTFRSPAPLVQAVNTLFQRPSSLLKDGLDFTPATSGLTEDMFLDDGGSRARLEAWIVPDEQADAYSNNSKRLPLIADTVASEIVRLLQSGARIVQSATNGGETGGAPVNPGNFAVLVSSRFEADAMIQALQSRQVPAIQAKAADIMTSDEAGELLVLLRAMEDPRRSALRLAALATRLMGRTADDIRRIREDAAEDDALLEKFLRWQEVLHRQGIAAALAEIDRDEKISLRLAGTLQGDRRVTNLRQLTDLLQSAALDLANRPGHLVRWFGQEIARSDSGTDERQQQLESDAQAVKIVTMHSAKGLEYDLVFCPFLWSAKNLKKDQRAKKLSRPGLPPLLVNPGLADHRHDSAFARAALEDRLRLAYVAVTRARVKAWILGGALSGNKPAPSALDWLLRVEDEPGFDDWCAATGPAARGSLHKTGLASLIAAGGSVIEQREPPGPSSEIWQPSDSLSSPTLSALVPPEIPAPWVMTSFSSLTREKNPHSGGESVPAEPTAVQSNPFFSAPGGAMVGTAIHEWIQQWDFSDTAGMNSHLAKYPLPAPGGEGALHESVAGMLDQLRDAVLPGMDCTIATACPHAEASEWHFQLPINDSLSSRSLAEVFANHGEPDYAAMLDTLPAEELKGYLHGFLDRLAFHNGVWGVIDWKTNKLAHGYEQPSLRSCAMQSHYLLQTHLYLVALRRFLGPDVRIAGAWLVFLRGIRPGTSDGILHIQPSDALMKDLDALFAKSTAHF